jgi:predicted metal-dependent hydrolase
VPEEIDSFSGLHCRETWTIYLRVLKDDAEMPAILVHEMAHAATMSGHDDRFWAEMRRLQAEGAPVLRELNFLDRKKMREAAKPF